MKQKGATMSRILVIEDNKTLANLIAKKIFSELSVEVDTAYTLKEAKLFLSRYNYFIVLTDLNLPDSPDGEVVDYLLKKDQKVIILTSNIDKAFRKRMMEKSIIDYIKKSGAADIKYVIEMIKRLRANQKHTVLVADDSMPMRTRFKNLLEHLFFNVITVAHGEEALNILQNRQDVSMLITDYNMPVINGFELTKEIRKKLDKNTFPIIAVSSNEDEELIALFLKNGANDYIKKPFSKEEFYCRINNSIESYENIQTILNSANRDFLTGLYNRRYFFQHINSLCENAKENYLDVYIAMVDIDKFKSINDTYGHDEGDKAIVMLSEILQSSTQPKDLVSRFGGEEFCIALIAQDQQTAYAVCERIRASVENASFVSAKGEEIRYTVSIGLAKHEEADINETINQADMNLYEAKNSGRNKIVFKENR